MWRTILKPEIFGKATIVYYEYLLFASSIANTFYITTKYILVREPNQKLAYIWP